MSEGVDFRSVLEASANCYMLLDRDLRYVWANAAYLRLAGCPLDQLAGRGVFEVFPHDPADPDNESSALLRRSLEKVLATRERDVLACIPYRVPRSPGGSLEERLWSATHTPLLSPDGEVELVLQHTVEVTELARLREAAEPEMFSTEAGVLGRAELVQQANRNLDTQLGDLRRMFDQAPGFFCFLRGPEHVFEIANGAYLRMIGKRDIIGRPLREALPELDGQGFPELLDRVYRTGEPFVGRGIRVSFAGTPRAEAFEIIVDFVYQPIADASGRVFGIFVQGNDITVQKQLEAEREQLLAREQAARAEAERANQLKDEFLATVGHELRTPLNAMLGWVQLLRAGKLTEERRQRALEIVERNARAQAEIINDILDVSRIMSGKLRLESGRLDAMAVVESAVESARPSAHAKGIHLSAGLEGTAEVIGDAVRLQQAVGNLLANAVKFTPAGGSVSVHARVADSELRVVVSDTGKGVAPEFLPHLFERFRQAESTKSRKHGGLGLGLAIVKEIIELHGGRVSAGSAGPDRGATFTLHLPAARRRSDAVAPAMTTKGATATRCPPQLIGRRLLVVDDEPDARDLVRAMLEECGLEIELASNLEETLTLLQRRPPDLLLSDLGMPGDDGLTLIRRVRALPPEHGGHIPAVALTAYARAEDRTQALLAGYRAHVSKPVDRDELLTVLASVLSTPTDPEREPLGVTASRT